MQSTESKASEWQAGPLLVQARNLLATHAHLRSGVRRLRVDAVDCALVVTGTVPSFFHKQLVQEALRPLGVPITNDLRVE